MEVLTKILQQGTEFETLAETVLADRFERLVELVTMIGDKGELPIAMALASVVANPHMVRTTRSSVAAAQQQQEPFNGRLSRTTRVGRYQKKHSPAHTHPGQRTVFITFLHLQRSMASSLFSLRA